MNTSPTIYLIDGTAYIHRAFHAIRNLSNSQGLPTNAVFGFTRMLIKLMEDCRPEFGVMLFDTKGPTFRHERYSDYKANRPPMPDAMAIQIPYIKQVTEGFNFPVIEKSGFEADDLIGTLARAAEKKGFHAVIVSGDKDLVQLISQNVSIFDPMKDKRIDLQTVQADFGLEPNQLIDVMGLSGDASDNVPGVPGIGQKTALSLIREYGSMELLYEQVDSITRKKQRENLISFKDQAFLSRELVTIDTNVPLSMAWDDFKLTAPDGDTLADLFQVLEFRQLQQTYKTAKDLPPKKYAAVLNKGDLTALETRLRETKRFSLDTETTSENPMKADLVGISVALEPHEAFYIPCGHTDTGGESQLPLDVVLSRLKKVFEDPECHKIGQNIKYDWMVLTRHGAHLKGVVFDTMVASYLLNPSKRAHNLDQIALDFLGHKTITFSDVMGKNKGKKTFADIPLDRATPYACEDADITLLAYEEMLPRLEKIGLTDLMEQVEMPLIPVLMAMEMKGVRVDVERLQELSHSFADQLKNLETEIYEIAGETFNINSSQQLGAVLFEKLKLPTQKKTRKKTGYSTDVEVLTTLSEQHELPALVLRHRSLAKLKSTYTDALIDLVNPETGRIHTSYNQTVAATGRLSSSDPNLQNIPIRTEEGMEIRRAFVPKQGWVMLSADYSQIELRILAHYSDDPTLIKAFQDEEDIHTRTATEVFNLLPGFVTPELRRQAKAINFGIVYGMSPYGLSKQLGISQKMARTYIEHYFERYPGVQSFLDRTIQDAHQNGRTSTLMGRIRLLPDISSPNRNLRQFAERTAINTPIQGTAADLIKLAMIRVDDALRGRRLNSAMLLTVHDELVFEVPPEELDEVQQLVCDVMEGVWELRVPLKVNVAVGQNWAEAH